MTAVFQKLQVSVDFETKNWCNSEVIYVYLYGIRENRMKLVRAFISTYSVLRLIWKINWNEKKSWTISFSAHSVETTFSPEVY